LLVNEYDKAIEILLKAEKINPKDAVILGNIAHSYQEKGNKKKAVEYYKKVIQYGDVENAQRARDQLKKLEG
jgi:tetratricopeptide (TPR) repeat protein